MGLNRLGGQVKGEAAQDLQAMQAFAVEVSPFEEKGWDTLKIGGSWNQERRTGDEEVR